MTRPNILQYNESLKSVDQRFQSTQNFVYLRILRLNDSEIVGSGYLASRVSWIRILFSSKLIAFCLLTVFHGNARLLNPTECFPMIKPENPTVLSSSLIDAFCPVGNTFPPMEKDVSNLSSNTHYNNLPKCLTTLPSSSRFFVPFTATYNCYLSVDPSLVKGRQQQGYIPKLSFPPDRTFENVMSQNLSTHVSEIHPKISEL